MPRCYGLERGLQPSTSAFGVFVGPTGMTPPLDHNLISLGLSLITAWGGLALESRPEHGHRMAAEPRGCGVNLGKRGASLCLGTLFQPRQAAIAVRACHAALPILTAPGPAAVVLHPGPRRCRRPL